jgi:hypothetical protein
MAVAACLLSGAGYAEPASTGAPEVIRQDLAQASPDIQWPRDFEPAHADLFAHNEIQLQVPCSTVWARLIAVKDWPKWYPNASDSHAIGSKSGLLEKNGHFTWRVFGSSIDARVDVFEANRRLYWLGAGKDVHTYHTWLLAQQKEGCHVVTEEVANGARMKAVRKGPADGLHRSHELWLQKLHEATEGGSPR